jgi:hypothetical protein
MLHRRKPIRQNAIVVVESHSQRDEHSPALYVRGKYVPQQTLRAAVTHRR